MSMPSQSSEMSNWQIGPGEYESNSQNMDNSTISNSISSSNMTSCTGTPPESDLGSAGGPINAEVFVDNDNENGNDMNLSVHEAENSDADADDELTPFQRQQQQQDETIYDRVTPFQRSGKYCNAGGGVLSYKSKHVNSNEDTDNYLTPYQRQRDQRTNHELNHDKENNRTEISNNYDQGNNNVIDVYDEAAFPTLPSLSPIIGESDIGTKRKMSLIQKQPVINATLATKDTGNVIIIKLLDNDSSKIINDPIKVAKLIAGTIFDNQNIIIRTNKIRGLIIAELKTSSTELIKTILAKKVLKQIPIECSLPKSDNTKYGVISPVSTASELEDIKQIIRSDDDNIKIINVDRLQKRDSSGKWITSETLKITFAGPVMPAGVIIAHSYYKTRPFVQIPVQCFKCQRIGHTSGSCTARIRCLLCSGNHSKDNCRALTHKCANCGGPHIASSKECTIIRDARKIEQIRANTGKPYNEARNEFLKRTNFSNQNGNLQMQKAETMIVNDKRQEIVSKRPTSTGYIALQRVQCNLNKKQMVTRGTQTVNNDINIHDKDTKINNETFFEKLKSCIIELFQSSIFRENRNNQSLIVESTIRSHFGKELRNENEQECEGARKELKENTGKGTKRPTECILEEEDVGVISSQDNTTDTEGFITVEKRMVRANNMNRDETLNKQNKKQKSKKKKSS